MSYIFHLIITIVNIYLSWARQCTERFYVGLQIRKLRHQLSNGKASIKTLWLPLVLRSLALSSEDRYAQHRHSLMLPVSQH